MSFHVKGWQGGKEAGWQGGTIVHMDLYICRTKWGRPGWSAMRERPGLVPLEQEPVLDSTDAMRERPGRRYEGATSLILSRAIRKTLL